MAAAAAATVVLSNYNNNFSNPNDTAGGPLDFDGCCHLSWQVRQVIFGVYLVAIVIGIVGGALVIYAFWAFQSLRTSTFGYLSSLACADILFLLCLLMEATNVLWEEFLFGQTLCKLFLFCLGVSKFAASFSLLATSYDRYLAVVHPTTSQRQRQFPYVVRLILLSWGVAILIQIPVALWSLTIPAERNVEKDACVVTWPWEWVGSLYSWANALLTFVIPAVAITLFYSLVIRRMRQGSHFVGGAATLPRGRVDTNRRVTRLILCLIACYIGLWTPYYVFQILLQVVILPEMISQHVVSASYSVALISYISAVINPLLYVIGSHHFRDAMRDTCAGRRHLSKRTHSMEMAASAGVHAQHRPIDSHYRPVSTQDLSRQ